MAEYTLPILSNTVGKGKTGGKKLPPINEQQQDSQAGLDLGMDMEMSAEGVEYDMDGNPVDPRSALAQQMMDYDQEYDDEEMDDEDGDENALHFDDFRNIIETEGP